MYALPKTDQETKTTAFLKKNPMHRSMGVSVRVWCVHAFMCVSVCERKGGIACH